MKIAFISCFSIWHTEPDIANALEKAGHEVWRYHYTHLDEKKFLEMASRFDSVITSVPHSLPVDFLLQVKAEGPMLIAWYFDWLWDYLGRHKQYTARTKHFDLVLSSDGETDYLYKREGINRRWLPMACNPNVYKPVSLSAEDKKEYGYDVGFVGHAYFPRRRKLLGKLYRDFDFRHWGQSSECYGPVHATICNATKIMVADNFRNDVPGYWSNRVYCETGSGAFLLHPRIPRMEKHFADGEHLVYYDDLDDLCVKIRYYLKHEDERKRIASQGSRHIHKNHSWAVRIKEFEKILCESGLSPTQTAQVGLDSSAGTSLNTSMPILSSQSGIV